MKRVVKTEIAITHEEQHTLKEALTLLLSIWEVSSFSEKIHCLAGQAHDNLYNLIQILEVENGK